jgi:hypothetical protein
MVETLTFRAGTVNKVNANLTVIVNKNGNQSWEYAGVSYLNPTQEAKTQMLAGTYGALSGIDALYPQFAPANTVNEYANRNTDTINIKYIPYTEPQVISETSRSTPPSTTSSNYYKAPNTIYLNNAPSSSLTTSPPVSEPISSLSSVFSSPSTTSQSTSTSYFPTSSPVQQAVSNLTSPTKSSTSSSSQYVNPVFTQSTSKVPYSNTPLVTPEEYGTLTTSQQSSVWEMPEVPISQLGNTFGTQATQLRQVELRDEPLGQTFGTVTENIARKSTYEEVFSTPSSLTETNIGDIYKSNFASAKDIVKSLPSSEQKSLAFNSLKVGVIQGMAGVSEFTSDLYLNLGFRQVTPEQDFGSSIKSSKIFTKSYEEGIFGAARSYPRDIGTISGQLLTLAPGVYSLGKGLFSGVKSSGLSNGLKGVAKSFSPITIKEGVYSPALEKPLKVISFRQTNAEGVMERVYFSQQGEIKVLGREFISSTGEGTGYVAVSKPFVKITQGGANVKTGRLTRINTYETLPFGEGKPTIRLNGLKLNTGEGTIGSVSSVRQYTGKGKSESFYTAGVSKEFNGKTYSVSGKAQVERVISMEEYGPVYTTSNKFRTKPDIKVIEVDLTRTGQNFENAGGKYYTTTSTRGGTISASIKDIKIKPVTSTRVKTAALFSFDYAKPIGPMPQATTISSTATITKQIQETKRVTPVTVTITEGEGRNLQRRTPSQIPITVSPTQETKGYQTYSQQIQQSINSENRISQEFKSVQIPKLNEGITSATKQTPRTSQGTKQTTQQITKTQRVFNTPVFAVPNIPRIRTPKSIAMPYIPSLGGAGGMGGSGILRGGRRTTGYIPSYQALVFKIRGSYKPTKYSKSGLDFRPFSSKFKISKRRKL